MDLWLRTPGGMIYDPLPSQAEFHAATEKYRAYIGGVRAGKTLSGCFEDLTTALTYPGSVGLVGRWSYRELTATTWAELKAITPPELIAGLCESPQKIYMDLKTPGGKISRIWGWNLSNWKTLTSLTLDWFHVDELTELPDDKCWNQLQARLSGSLGKPLRGWGTGTPAGHDWVWKLFVRKRWGDYKYVKAPTRQNFYLPPGYEENLRRTGSPDWVERFLDAEFNVFEGQIFHSWDERVHVIDRFDIPDHWPRFRSIDPGIADACAALLGTSDEAGNVYITDEYYQANKTVSEQCEAILRMTGDAQIAWTVIDPVTANRSGETGKSRIDLYREHGIKNVMPANNRVDDSIALIQQLLMIDPVRKHPLRDILGSPRLFVFRNCVNLRSEMNTWRYGPSGRPVDKDDHAISALRYLLMRRPHPAEPKVEKVPNNSWARFRSILRDLNEDDQRTLPRIGSGPGAGVLVGRT